MNVENRAKGVVRMYVNSSINDVTIQFHRICYSVLGDANGRAFCSLLYAFLSLAVIGKLHCSVKAYKGNRLANRKQQTRHYSVKT